MLITHSPLPFPDWGIVLRGSVSWFTNLCDTKQAASTHGQMSRVVFVINTYSDCNFSRRFTSASSHTNMKYLIPLLAFSFLIGCDGEKSNERPSKDSPEEAFTKSSYNKRTRLLFLLLILIVPCVSAQVKKSPLRTWTSDIGTKIEAELVSIADGEVTLKTKTGRTDQVTISGPL